MSKGDELYVKESGSSDLLIVSETEDQIWDDSSMTAAYDKAVNKANAEIAKQIAMETNSKCKGTAKSNAKKGKTPIKLPKSSVWKVGMPCRAYYVGDGHEYEAVVYAILDNGECVVRFVGYDNTEIVCMASLMGSYGEEARNYQIKRAAGDKFDDGESLSNEEDASAPGIQHKVKLPKKELNKLFADYMKIPKAPMPDLRRMNFGFTQAAGSFNPDFRMPNIPFPPPPPPAALHISDPEEQALSSMLISWYMSGYHTGLYHGLKRARENRRH